MSALGHKRTSDDHVGYVRFAPESGHWRVGHRMSALCQKRTLAELFDHLVGAREQGRGHLKAEGLRSLEVDDQFVLGWRLHRQIGRLLALEDAVDIAGGAPVLVDEI